MIEAADFLEPARDLGFDFWAGVPCSYLKPFINYVIDDPGLTWIASANEGDAVATATGATLGGRSAVAIMQNSGLGNAVSPLSSLNWVFRVPILLVITLRGDPEHGDEPQHELMGRVTTGMLEQLEVPWAWFPTEAAKIEEVLGQAKTTMDRTGRPYALVMRKGSVAPHALGSEPPAVERHWPAPPPVVHGDLPSRNEVLRAIQAATPETDSVVVATTGFTGRELYALQDRPNQLYMVGSMGCASSLALGLSLARPDLRVVVADGDGAALMRMGNLATLGAYGGDGLAHVILDNGRHESTGGQATVSHGVRFAALAAACGYGDSVEAGNAQAVTDLICGDRGPRLAHVRTRPGVPEGLPRPSIKPQDVVARLVRHIGHEPEWLPA